MRNLQVSTICWLLLAVLMMTACTTASSVVRPAPKEGVEVQGLNILFMITPPDFVSSSQSQFLPTQPSARPANANDITTPRPEAERLRNEVKGWLPRKLNEKGIPSNFASLDVLPGVAPTPLEALFPRDARSWHTLVIIPVRETTTTSTQQATVTKFTLSMSLRTARENKEIWNFVITQRVTVGNIFPNKNDQLIEDMVKAVLGVVRKGVRKEPVKGQSLI